MTVNNNLSVFKVVNSIPRNRTHQHGGRLFTSIEQLIELNLLISPNKINVIRYLIKKYKFKYML